MLAPIRPRPIIPSCMAARLARSVPPWTRDGCDRQLAGVVGVARRAADDARRLLERGELDATRAEPAARVDGRPRAHPPRPQRRQHHPRARSAPSAATTSTATSVAPPVATPRSRSASSGPPSSRSTTSAASIERLERRWPTTCAGTARHRVRAGRGSRSPTSCSCAGGRSRSTGRTSASATAPTTGRPRTCAPSWRSGDALERPPPDGPDRPAGGGPGRTRPSGWPGCSAGPRSRGWRRRACSDPLLSRRAVRTAVGRRRPSPRAPSARRSAAPPLAVSAAAGCRPMSSG